MQKILKLFLSFCIVFGLFSIPSYANNDGYAAIINSDFYAHNGMTINGNVISSTGNFNFDKSHRNTIIGDVYVNQNSTYTDTLETTTVLSGEIIRHSDSDFKYSLNPICDIPEIDNYTAAIAAGYYPLPEDITSDIHIGTLTVSNYLKVDTTNGDVSIVCDDFKLNGNGSIDIIGDGKVNLFVKGDVILNGSTQIGDDLHKDSINLFVVGDISINGSANVFATAYLYDDEIVMSGSGTLTGNIITPASKFEIFGNGLVNGIVYAPYADAIVRSGGEIKGQIICNTLEICTNAIISYDEALIAEGISTDGVKHRVTVSVENGVGGDATVDKEFYNKGEVAKLSFAPKSNFSLNKVVSSINQIPDSSGELVVLNDNDLMVTFSQADTSPSYNMPFNLDNDYAYIFGRTNSRMEAHDTIRRGEACAVLYRLLKQNNMLGNFKYDRDAECLFKDIEGRWDRSAIEYMTHLGLYQANPAGNIFPVGTLTRGEAFKLICISLGFTDDTTLSYQDYTDILVDYGCVVGYDESAENYGIDNNITRAQFCKIYNIIIGRDRNGLTLPDGTQINTSTYGIADLAPGDWAYEIMLRATSAYDKNGNIDIEARARRNEVDDY